MIERGPLMTVLNELEKAIFDLSREVAVALVTTHVSADHAAAIMRIVGRQLRAKIRRLEDAGMSHVTSAEEYETVSVTVAQIHLMFGAPGRRAARAPDDRRSAPGRVSSS